MIPSRHPKGTRARVLLSSVFGPYAQDDQFGSRTINPMELYHNQVTRVQGSFSLRRFHRSWGILMIQENISAPCAVLDFPTREAFERELTAHHYDVVGISSIIVNVGKAREMCRLVRKLSPHSTIVVGGHVAAIPGIEQILDADHIVKGDGIAWMREYLGEDVNAPIRHPELSSGFRPARDGRQSSGQGGRVGHHHRVGRLPDGLQFLHDVGVLRRQGKNPEPVLHRGGIVPPDGASGNGAPCEIVLHHGRELPPAKEARDGAAGAHAGGGKELGVPHLLVGERDPEVQLRGTGATRHLVHLGGSGIAALELLQAGRRRYPEAGARASGAWHCAAGFHHHRAGAPHAGEYRRRDRTRHLPRDGPASIHAVHAGARDAALSAR